MQIFIRDFEEKSEINRKMIKMTENYEKVISE